jgi:hypothetical protein
VAGSSGAVAVSDTTNGFSNQRAIAFTKSIPSKPTIAIANTEILLTNTENNTSLIKDGVSFIETVTSFIETVTSFIETMTSFIETVTSFIENVTSFVETVTSFIETEDREHGKCEHKLHTHALKYGKCDLIFNK